MSALFLRLRIWFAMQRLVVIRDEARYHRSLAISLADQADRLERDITVAQLQLAAWSPS